MTEMLRDQSAIRRVVTADEFNHWLKRERQIAAVVYFEGDLARFRKEAGNQVVRLEAMEDKRRPRDRKVRFELEELQKRVALCREAQRHGQFGNVHLTQERKADGDGWIYIATRPGRASSTED